MKKNKIKVSVEPIGKRFFLDGPKNALSAIQDSGIGIKSVCAGKGTCGKCRIMVLHKKELPVSKQEEKVLSQSEIAQGVRLACQQVLDSDINIYIPASSLSEEQKLQVVGREEKIDVDPVVHKYFLKLLKATLRDVDSDFTRIKDALKSEYSAEAASIDYRVLFQMPRIIRENNWEITVTLRETEVIMIEGQDQSGSAYGVAIDLGTTKIAVLLVDLLSGQTIDKKGVMNPQISFGEDVMSRIDYASRDDEHLLEMKKAVTDAINLAVSDLCRSNQIEVSQILELTMVANTAMHHLFLGLPVKQLGLSPFPSLISDAMHVKASDIGLDLAYGAYVYCLSTVAGFIGSDHMAMILASSLFKKKGNCIGIDIGTNTEIALVSGQKIHSVSTASGPAFEGAHIKYGMRAAPGAIERVVIDKKTCIPSIQTIEDRDAVGICGSGILDAIAELLKAGIIDRRGKFIKDSGCICSDAQGNMQYVLTPGFYGQKEQKNNSNEKDNDIYSCADGNVSINQKDIVEIQLAKSAIRTGIEILLENAGIDFKDIDEIIIAGAFGSYIDPKNVINIGMFPKVDLEKISQVGNAAGVGAKMVLISREQRDIAEKVSSNTNYLELTTFPSFSEHFANSVLFPEAEEII